MLFVIDVSLSKESIHQCDSLGSMLFIFLFLFSFHSIFLVYFFPESAHG